MRKLPKYIPGYPGIRVRKDLTRKLNCSNWFVYKDPIIGMYAYNPKDNRDVNLMVRTIKSSEVTKDVIIKWRTLIEESI